MTGSGSFGEELFVGDGWEHLAAAVAPAGVVDHAHDTGFLDALDNELDRQLQSRAWRIAADPTDYHLHVLGPTPADPDHLATWRRAATILDRHNLGLDRSPPWQERSSLLGGQRERAETMARLEVMAIPREPEPISRTIERDLGLDLFG